MTHRRVVAGLTSGILIVLATASSAAAATKTVSAGPPGRAAADAPRGLELNDFYRKRVTVNVGDTVSWQINGFHSVTFAGGQAPPPFIVPDADNPVSDVNDPAGNPFWFNGQPNFALSSQAASPVGGSSFDGSGLRNSGLPLAEGRPKPYKLKFTRAGSYRYICLVHPGMSASVKVQPKGRAVPSARQDAAAARAEAAADVRTGIRLDRVKPRTQVLAGHDRRGASLLKFFPSVKTVKVGTTVEFKGDSREEAHTVSFGPRLYREQQARTFVSPRPTTPDRPPVFAINPIVFYPSDPPPAFPPYTGTNHGNGYLNTGLIDGAPSTPIPSRSRVTFATKGSFEYECLVHPGMRGRIRVR